MAIRLIPFFANGSPASFPQRSKRDRRDRSELSRSRVSRQAVHASGRRVYEWRTNAERRKAPFYIAVVDQPVFAFAGLWGRSVKADGTAIESVHIMMPANALMRDSYNAGINPVRMPAILRRGGMRHMTQWRSRKKPQPTGTSGGPGPSLETRLSFSDLHSTAHGY